MAGRFSVEAVFKAVDRVTAPVSRMQNRIGKMTRSVERGLRNVDRAVSNVAGGMMTAAKAAAALATSAAGIVGLTTVLTAADVEAQMLADSVGVNVNTMDALAKAVGGAGFEFDNVVDLVEEMNNKLGESAGLEEITPVTESLQILGLEFEKIKKLSPEKQFKAITDAALQMEDAQKAAAAADILLGGEANKIIGVLRQQGKTVDDIVKSYTELSFRTEESRQGAAAFQKQWRATTGVISSVTSELAGLSGGAMAPLLTQFTEWVKLNRELIKSSITGMVERISQGVRFLIDNFADIAKWTKRIGVALAVFFAFAAVLKTLVLVMTAVNLVMAANPITLVVLAIVALIAAISAAVFWWDEIKAAVVDFAKAVADKVVGAFVWLRDTLVGLPGPIKAAIAILAGPIGWLIGAAALVMENWGPIRQFFADLWGDIVGGFMRAIDSIKSTFNSVSTFFGFGDEGQENQGAAQMVSPQARTARSIEEQRTTSTAEVTIKDESGRAELTGGSLGPGLSLQPTGAF